MTKIKYIIPLIIAYLLLAPLSYKLLPYMGFYGADVSMQYNFHHCSLLESSSEKLYEVAGIDCNDPVNKYYAYPVLIYRFFSWATLFTDFQNYYYFWSALIILTLLSLPFFWLKTPNLKSGLLYFSLACLSLIQANSYYALERGGTDITFLIAWMIASYFALKEKWFLSGSFMALAALLKLYPVMAIIPLLMGLFLQEKERLKSAFFKTRFFYICLGLASTGGLVLALDYQLWSTFIFKVLPHETKFHIGTNAIGHSLIGPFPKVIVYIVMFGFWFILAKIFAQNDLRMKRFALAGTLGLSTYFTNHSFDYNLITLFPLLYIIGELYFDNKLKLFNNKVFAWSFLILILTTLGPSNILFGTFKFLIRMKLILEISSLALICYSVFKQSNQDYTQELKP